MIFKDNLLFPEKTIVNVISAPAQIKFTHLKCVQLKQNYFIIDWICSFSSGTKILHFSDDHIMVSSHPFQFLRPATLESFLALLFLSQKSSSMFSQFCWLLIQQWLLLLCWSLCWLFHGLLVGFRLQFLNPHHLFMQHRVIPMKVKLGHAMPLFRNLQLLL